MDTAKEMTAYDINEVLGSRDAEIASLRAALAAREVEVERFRTLADNAAAEVDRERDANFQLRRSIGAREAEVERLMAQRAMPEMSDERAAAIAKIAHDMIREQCKAQDLPEPRASAAWRAEDRQARIHELVEKYAGQIAAAKLAALDAAYFAGKNDAATPYAAYEANIIGRARGLARSLATAVVEAEE